MAEKPKSAEAERFDAAKRQIADAWDKVCVQWKHVSPQNRPAATGALHSPDWVALIAGLKSAGWSQTELANECGVTQQSISALASGVTKSPSYDLGMSLQRLAELSIFTLPAGTLCHRNGVPFKLLHAAQIQCHPSNWAHEDQGEPGITSESVEQPASLERHSGCLLAGQSGPSAPISQLSNEGRCVQCISTTGSPGHCR